MAINGVELPWRVVHQTWHTDPVYDEDHNLIYYRVSAVIIVEPPTEPNFVVGKGD